MIELKNVSETLWLPLFGKAIESKRNDGFIHDQKAIEIAEKACKLNPDLNKWWTQLSKELQALMVWRNLTLDAYVSDFISRNGKCTIVNLGAGLCTRYERFKQHPITWLEFDLPDVKNAWLEFNEENEQHRYYTLSIFEEEWLDQIDHHGNQPVMFIAEGLLMYFSKSQVNELLSRLADRYPNGEFVFEAYSKFLLRKPQKDVKKTSAERFPNPWGIKTGKDFEKWNSKLVHINDDYLLKHQKALKRMPITHRFAAQFPMIKKAGKMVHLRFKTA